MPRIDITEKDLTTAPLPQYSNFAVVVPGFVHPDRVAARKQEQQAYMENPELETTFDEAGVATFTSSGDFVDLVGKYEVKDTVAKDAKAPTLTNISGGEGQAAKEVSTVTQAQFYGEYWDHTKEVSLLYVPTLDTTVGDTEGYLKKNLDLVNHDFSADFTTTPVVVPTEITEYATPDPNGNGIKVESGNLIEAKIYCDSKVVIKCTAGKQKLKINNSDYEWAEGTTTGSEATITIDNIPGSSSAVIVVKGSTSTVLTEGQTYIKSIEVTKVEGAVVATQLYKLTQAKSGEWSETQKYVYIKSGDEGNDAQTAQRGHYGNQIAFELLKQGYTVLYKWLENEKTSEGIEIPGSFINVLGSRTFWEALTDRATYEFRYIVSGLRGATDIASVNNEMSALATFDQAGDYGRGDCIALLDVNEDVYKSTKTQKEFVTAVATEIGKYSNADKYSAIFAPNVVYSYSDSDYENCTFPASFHYLACAKRSRSNGFAEWYAAAGPQRGVCGYSIKSTVGPKLGEVTYNTFEPRRIGDSLSPIQTNITKAVNIIAKIKSIYYLYGNRTAHQLKASDLVASHFLNIRELNTTIKKQAYVTCKSLMFEPNGIALFTNFCDGMRPTLAAMKTDNGVFDYKFVKEATTQKGKLKARIEISPIEAVEDFDIELTLVDSSTGQTEVTVTE